MNRFRHSLCRMVTMIVFAPGCSSNKTPVSDEPSRLVFQVDGSEVELPVEVMDVYLVEDQDEYPETFQIRGDGLLLVGTFPNDLHVGYGEHWEQMVGRVINIVAEEDVRARPETSVITLPDAAEASVAGGQFIVEKLNESPRGDSLLSGKITLQVAQGKALEGTFTMIAKTWG